MSLFDYDCHSSDSEADADFVPEYSSEEEPLPPSFIESKTEKANKQNVKKQPAIDIEKIAEKVKKGVDEQKKANDLFKNFLSDCETEMKAREAESGIFEASSSVISTPEVDSESLCTASPSSEISKSSSVCDSIYKKSPDGKEAVELFQFAGETVCVSKDDGSVSLSNNVNDSIKIVGPQPVLKRKRFILESILGVIQNKKPKLSTLEKSLLDWKKFKQSEGIEDELRKHNLGKGGFIERQHFLQRSDLRAFEIERDMRLSRHKK